MTPFIYELSVSPPLRPQDKKAFKVVVHNLKKRCTNWFNQAPENTISFAFRGSKVTIKRTGGQQCEQALYHPRIGDVVKSKVPQAMDFIHIAAKAEEFQIIGIGVPTPLSKAKFVDVITTSGRQRMVSMPLEKFVEKFEFVR